MGWALRLLCMKQMDNAYKILSTDGVEDIDVDGWIIQ